MKLLYENRVDHNAPEQRGPHSSMDSDSPAAASAEQLVDSPPLAFAHLNLYRNPFGEWTREERAELAVVEIEPLLQHLAGPRAAVLVVGECGRGKTTHLLAIHRHFPNAPFRYIAECERHPALPNPVEDQPYFIDELQRLTHTRRRRLYKQGLALVIGSHEEHEVELRSMGYAVLTIKPADRLTAEKLHAVLTRRIIACRRGSGPMPRIRPSTVQSLIDRFGTDVRAIEAHLYDVFQALREPCDV